MHPRFLCLLLLSVSLLGGCNESSGDSDREIYLALFNYVSKNTTEETSVVFSEQAIKTQDIFHSFSSEIKDVVGNEISEKDYPEIQLQNLLPAAPLELRSKFIAILQSGGNLNKSDIPDTTKIKPLFVSASDLEAVFAQSGDQWKSFRAKYKAMSLLNLSRPAIDLTNEMAIVYLGVSCGGTCGQGNLFLLAKLKGKWVVVHEQNIWVS